MQRQFRRLMTSIFKTPVSVVTILGDTDAWSKSCAGPFGNVSVPRTETVCNSVIVPSVPEVLVVEDMSKDARFFRIPFVEGPPYLRFYAGAPLLGSNGHRYGTLCILDYEPRSFPPQLLNTLINFAELATRELERGCVNARPPSAVPVKRLRSRAVENQAVALLDMQSSKWKVLWVNEPWAADVGRLPDTGCAGSVAFWDLFELDDSGAKAALSAIQPALQTQQPVRLCVRRRGNGFAARLSVVFRPATDALAPDIPVVIPAVAADLGSSGSAAQAFGTSAVSPWFAILEEAPSTPTVAQQPQSPMQMSEEMAPPPAEFDAAKLLHGVGLPPCLNGLQIGPLLGVGSYGRVHYGLWQGTLVAVKIVDVPADASPEVRSLLANSMLQCKATMCHPNVVRTISAVFDEQKVGSAVCPEGCARLWFLLEYCDKGRLLDAVERGWLVCRNETADGHAQAEPDMQSILLTARDIAAGLVHLHSMGAVHGDLTGANILLASSGADSRGWVAKLSDVGLPGLDQLSSTSTTNHCGTVAYM